MDTSAQQILSALRLGSVPASGLHRLAVGRELQMAELGALLEEVTNKKCALKFITGNYGSGKSFLCSSVSELAFEKGFAVSTVIISPETPLAKFDVVVGRVFDGIRLPGKRNACALTDLLERWLYQLLKKVAVIEGINPDDPMMIDRIESHLIPKINEELSSVPGVDASFVNVISAFMRAKLQRDHLLANDALGWLKANTNLAGNKKQKLGVRGNLSPLIALNFIKGLLHILHASGFKGLLLIIDEVETIQRLPHERLRINSYESLRMLVDQVADESLPGLMLVLTGTPKLMEDRRYGIPSYDPLKQRFEKLSFPDGRHSLRQPVITINGFGKIELVEVALRVRDIHSIALDWEAQARLSTEHIHRLVEMAVNAFGGEVEKSPRSFLREMVHICDMLHEHPTLSMEEYFADDDNIALRLNTTELRTDIEMSIS